jgi:hypothetical protein
MCIAKLAAEALVPASCKETPMADLLPRPDIAQPDKPGANSAGGPAGWVA